jgi:hypothetical protein
MFGRERGLSGAAGARGARRGAGRLRVTTTAEPGAGAASRTARARRADFMGRF